MSEYETKDTTKSEREKKRKRFKMMPKDEFDIRFENNPDFDTPDMSRARDGGLIKKQFKYGGLTKPGLYANIHAKRKRIAAGSGEKMRKPGAKGAPTAKQFKRAAKTAKKK
jgi:hypothetical protein